MAISGIIMASGMSQRFGENKLLTMFKGRRLFEFTIEMLQGAEFDEKIVVSCYDEILKEAEKHKFITIFNYDFQQGQSASIRLGVNIANSKNQYAFFTCDQPMLLQSTVSDMIRFSNSNTGKIIVPRYGQRSAAPCFFPNSFRKELLSLRGDMGGKNIIKNNMEKVIYYDIKNELEILDIDTPEDLLGKFL